MNNENESSASAVSSILRQRPVRLFILLAGFFVTNALIAEFVGVKIFSFEKLLSVVPVNWTLFGQEGLSFNLSAGVVLWPVVFVMTDIINEYFGRRGVRMLSFMTAVLIAYAFIMVYFAIELPPADFWVTAHLAGNDDPQLAETLRLEVGNYNSAFRLVFGQGLWIIIGSLIAFLVGQFVDVFTFQRIKRLTGERAVWLRATGSTLVSQFIDSYVVLFVAFYFGADWPLVLVLAIGTVNYLYKFACAVLLTPVIYLGHYLIDRYLGKERAEAMKLAALDRN